MPMMDSIGRQRSSSLGVEHLPTHLIFPASDSPPVDFNRPRFRKAPPLSDPASPLKPAEISSPHRDSKESSAKPSRGKKPPRPDDTSSEKEKKHDKEKKSDSDKEEGKRSKHKEKEKGKEIEMIVEKENEDETVNVTPLPLENVPQPTDSENKVLSNRVDGGGGVSRPKVDAMVPLSSPSPFVICRGHMYFSPSCAVFPFRKPSFVRSSLERSRCQSSGRSGPSRRAQSLARST